MHKIICNTSIIVVHIAAATAIMAKGIGPRRKDRSKYAAKKAAAAAAAAASATSTSANEGADIAEIDDAPTSASNADNSGNATIAPMKPPPPPTLTRRQLQKQNNYLQSKAAKLSSQTEQHKQNEAAAIREAEQTRSDLVSVEKRHKREMEIMQRANDDLRASKKRKQEEASADHEKYVAKLKQMREKVKEQQTIINNAVAAKKKAEQEMKQMEKQQKQMKTEMNACNKELAHSKEKLNVEKMKRDQDKIDYKSALQEVRKQYAQVLEEIKLKEKEKRKNIIKETNAIDEEATKRTLEANAEMRAAIDMTERAEAEALAKSMALAQQLSGNAAVIDDLNMKIEQLEERLRAYQGEDAGQQRSIHK